MFRQPRVFISYCREDDNLREKIYQYLSSCGIEVLWDDRLRAGDVIDEDLSKLIRRADAVVALGTRRFMASPWCCREISYAISIRKRYYPLLFEDATSVVEDWFRGILKATSRQVIISEVRSREDASRWLPDLPSILQRHRPYEARSIVFLALLICLLTPLLFSGIMRLFIVQAHKEVLELQGVVERRNAKLEGDVGIAKERDGSNVMYYENRIRDGKEIRTAIARDIPTGTNSMLREFLDANRAIAVDEVSNYRNTEGVVTLRKQRRIFPKGGGQAAIIEDHFGPDGRLICKVVTKEGDRGSRVFTYDTVSQYPYWVWAAAYR